MKKTFNFRVSDLVFKVIQHDMEEKKPGVTVAYLESFNGKKVPEAVKELSTCKTVCHKDDKFNEFTGIKYACFKSMQKLFSMEISKLQSKIDQVKGKYRHVLDALNAKIEVLNLKKFSKE